MNIRMNEAGRQDGSALRPRTVPPARSARRLQFLQSTLVIPILVLGVPEVAHAVDGCRFLLCIAGNWKGIPLCVPTVQEVLKDLAKGKGYPSCDTSGPGNNASHSWMQEASCPEMYRNYDPYNGHYTGCTYVGAFNVLVNDAEWSTVYWSWAGDTSTRYTEIAKQELGDSIDPTYDAHQAAWDKAHPPPPPCWGDC